MAETRLQPEPLPRAAGRVINALEDAGHPVEIRLLDDRAPTAEKAAAALGVTTREIVKSMVFRGQPGDRLVIALLGGDRRVDVIRVGEALGGTIERADPYWVRERTGFAIGGVPPLGHSAPGAVLIDRDLLAEQDLWAGAGTPNALFWTTGRDLEELTGGVVADIAEQ